MYVDIVLYSVCYSVYNLDFIEYFWRYSFLNVTTEFNKTIYILLNTQRVPLFYKQIMTYWELQNIN